MFESKTPLLKRLTIFVACMFLTDCRPSGPPFDPKAALQTIKVEEGFRVETFASEPMISSPVALVFDERGRIYVVEMPGYPLDKRPIGRIKLLEDTDGDGRPDRVTIFADGLVLPTGVMRWKKGILVTAAPDVWYFEDTNGDGRADIKRKVLTGFALTNPQHTVNSPIYGLDNWIYLAHQGPAEAIIYKDLFGDQGTDIRFPDRPDLAPLKITDRSVRFRPDTYQLEALSGESQFGHAFDDWGHYFTDDSENHGRQEMIPARYLNRNPDLLAASTTQDLSDHGSNAKVFPISRRSRMKLLTGEGEMTSACSITRYLGGAFGADFQRVSFIAEPVYNLVHRDVWVDSGSTFVMKRAHQGTEFLASTDSWFSPVNFYIGPDGALYVIDYYREVIEHPEWLSTKDQKSKNLYHGNDRGRIYRIMPDTNPPLAPPGGIRLDQATDEEVVRQLGNPNIWWRRTAQRLLGDRRSDHSVEPLTRLFRESSSPLARLHALWTLDGLGKLDENLLEAALQDNEGGVRENAIILSESRLSSSPSLVARLLKLEGDTNAKVRFQLLCTLGFVNTLPARAVQERLLLHDIEDPWVQVAALSASSERAAQFLSIAVASNSPFTRMETPGHAAFFRQVATVAGARHRPSEIQTLLTAIVKAPQAKAGWWTAAGLEGLASGARGRPGASAAFRGSAESLLKVTENSPAKVRRASLELLKVAGLPNSTLAARLLKKFEATAVDGVFDQETRADAIAFLALAGPAKYAELFKKLVDPQQPEQVQAAAVRALGESEGEEIGRFLIDHWRALTPLARSDAADALEKTPSRTRLMLAAMKNEQIQTWTLNFSQKRALIMHEDADIRKIGRSVLEETGGEREKVVKRYEPALDMEGEQEQGKQVFNNVCAKCHKLNGVGHDVGPDLGTVRDRPATLLLEDILIPSKSIAPKHEAYVVETVSQGIQEGVMGPQTSNAITLRQEEGKETVISRKDIKRMYVSNLSAMPADLEKQIDLKQMAGLLKFLKTAK